MEDFSNISKKLKAELGSQKSKFKKVDALTTSVLQKKNNFQFNVKTKVFPSMIFIRLKIL